MEELDRKNELDIVQIRGDLKLIAQKVDSIKKNDLFHIQKSIDGINRVLWGVWSISRRSKVSFSGIIGA